MAVTKNRSKYAYLSYEKMLAKIASGELDAYDINFDAIEKQCYVIAPDLTPWAINSRVYTFDNVSIATETLNKNTDTYAGQIVAIQNNEKYTGYIVNGTKGNYTVSPLGINGNVDYNSLGNRPILNLSGTLSSPIVLDQQDDGYYMINGQYRISEKIQTIFSSAKSVLFVVETDEDDSKYVKKISAKEITSYIISKNSEEVNQSSILTVDFLKENGYVTSSDVDEKIAALDLFSKQDAENYISQYIKDNPELQTLVEQTVDAKIDEKITTASGSDIDNLF